MLMFILIIMCFIHIYIERERFMHIYIYIYTNIYIYIYILWRSAAFSGARVASVISKFIRDELLQTHDAGPLRGALFRHLSLRIHGCDGDYLLRACRGVAPGHLPLGAAARLWGPLPKLPSRACKHDSSASCRIIVSLSGY